MTLEEFAQSIETEDDPPEDLTDALQALWLAKKGRWEDSHNIAQDMPDKLGSWIHALLHTIEGDLGNAGYWYSLAGQPAIEVSQIDSEWERIAKNAILES